MADGKLQGLILLCLPLSLMSFGGGQPIIVGIQHQVVDVHHWISAQQFTDFFAISRAAPGPSTLIVALIGWQIAGIWGALGATLAIFGPSSLLVLAVSRWWESHGRSRLMLAIERGLIPIAVGLILAGTYAVAQLAHLRIADYFIIAVATVILGLTRVSSYVLLLGAAVLYGGLSFVGFGS